MHSGADVEAFQAALNRDIGGDLSTPPSDSNSVLSCGIKQSSTHAFLNWQTTSQDENASGPSQQQQKQEQHSSLMELKQHGSAAENQQLQNNVTQASSHLPLHQKQIQDDVQPEQTKQMSLHAHRTTGGQVSERKSMPLPESEKVQNFDIESQYSVQKMANQQALGMEQPGIVKNQPKQIPFALLLPALNPHLDKDREMQLQTLYNKLRKNEITKDQFVSLLRNIVGDQVLKLAVAQLQSQPGSNQSQLQSQAFAHPSNMRMPGASASSAVQAHAEYSSAENGGHKPQEVDYQPDSHGMQASQMPSSSASIFNQDRECPSIPVPVHSKQQQHVQFPQTSFQIYGNNSATYHPYSGTNINSSGSSVRQQPHDLQMRQMSHQSIGTIQMGGSTQAMNMMSVPKFERQTSGLDPSRLQNSSVSQYTNKSTVQQSSVPWQAPPSKQVKVEHAIEQLQKPQLSNPQSLSATLVEQGNAMSGNIKDEQLEKQSSKVGISAPTSNSASPSIATQSDPNVQVGSQIPSVTASAGANAKLPPKKPSIGQKKPLEALGSSPPMPSKKQKMSGPLSDQSIEQLNDVTAVSGVNLREEEEQLFSGSKEECQVSEASRRAVQEEEERLILQKTPLKKKLAIIS